MKCNIIFSLFCLLAIACQNEHEVNPEDISGDINKNISESSVEVVTDIPGRTIDKSLIDYDNSTSQWSLNDSLFSGYMVSFYEDGSPKSKTGIYNGKRQNKLLKWYDDGRLKEEASYHKGKLHGEKKLWSIEYDHILVSHLNYKNGKVHGQQKQWYKTGELYKILNIEMGKEEGLQQAYRKNGELYANYEAKNGRIFGLRKAALCYGIEDEKMKQ